MKLNRVIAIAKPLSGRKIDLCHPIVIKFLEAQEEKDRSFIFFQRAKGYLQNRRKIPFAA